MGKTTALIAIAHAGTIEVHIRHPNGQYATLCGMDGYDTSVDQQIVDLPPMSTVTCQDCIALVRYIRSLGNLVT